MLYIVIVVLNRVFSYYIPLLLLLIDILEIVVSIYREFLALLLHKKPERVS